MAALTQGEAGLLAERITGDEWALPTTVFTSQGEKKTAMYLHSFHFRVVRESESECVVAPPAWWMAKKTTNRYPPSSVVMANLNGEDELILTNRTTEGLRLTHAYGLRRTPYYSVPSRSREMSISVNWIIGIVLVVFFLLVVSIPYKATRISSSYALSEFQAQAGPDAQIEILNSSNRWSGSTSRVYSYTLEVDGQRTGATCTKAMFGGPVCFYYAPGATPPD